MVVTLTESMRKLLDNLIGTLCGVERSHIITSTMSALAKDLIRDLHPKAERWYTMANPERSTDISRKALAIVPIMSSLPRRP